MAVVMRFDRGGGCSMSSARATVAWKASASALGKEMRSVRSVGSECDADRNLRQCAPQLDGRSLRASQAHRLAGPERASIEREMSITTSPASVRTSSAVSDSATG